MADISTFDNFFDKFSPESDLKGAKYWKKAQHALKRHNATSKNSEIVSKVKPESKYLFHTLLSLMAHVTIQRCSRVMFLTADIVLLSDTSPSS